MPRELSITYGTFTVGGTSAREITGAIINTKKFKEASVEVEFVISKTTLSTFATEITDVEDAFRKPFQDLVVTQDGTDIYTYKQSTNTGLDAQPEILKREDDASGRHRKYRVRITVGLPANTGAELNTGLQEHNVEVAYDPARIRTVTITGVFTAAGSNNARTQYDAQIGSLETSVFSALSLTASNRELVEEPVADHSYNTKSLTFRRVWRELIFSQGGSSFDDADIKRQVLKIARRKEAPGDTPTADRLVTLDLDYSAWLDNTTNTNLRGKYDSIRGWLVTQIKNTLGSGTVAVVEEKPDFDYDENLLRVTMVAFGTSKSGIVENRVTTVDDTVNGEVLVPAWTGKPYSRYRYQGPGTKRRTITQTFRIVGGGGGKAGGGGIQGAGGGVQAGLNAGVLGLGIQGAPLTGAGQTALVNQIMGNQPPAGQAGQVGKQGGSAGFIPISTKVSKTPLKLGLTTENFDVTDWTIELVLEYYEPAASAGAGVTT